MMSSLDRLRKDNTLRALFRSGRSGTQRRFAELARLGAVVFHTGDLANIWGITNQNTLYTAIKRYVEQGLLVRIHKGFYAIKDPKDIDPLLLGIKAMHKYAYVSTETVLAAHGIIQQQLTAITLVSDRTKRFSVAGHQYYARKLADAFLYQRTGITERADGVRLATLERAVADLLYFNARAHLDAQAHINWKQVRALQSRLRYPRTPRRSA